MKMKNKFFLLSAGLLVSLIGVSQKKDFGFRRQVGAVDSVGWYSLQLPDEIFKNCNRQFSDLRIYEINEMDTVESPYLLTINQRQESAESITLKAVNQSKKGKTQYFTFALPKDLAVNYLNLEFVETNFDGFVKLEGSNDQRDWFEIEKHLRIISIENENVNFVSSALHFSTQNFGYLRVQVDADKLLSIKQASFERRVIKEGRLHMANLGWRETEDKKIKQSVFNINLGNYQPVVKLAVETNEAVDFYRPFRLERLSDSSKTQKGWQYFYETVIQGVLTSLDSNRFYFNYVTTKKLRLIINHGDNSSLKIKNIALYSPAVELVTHLEPGNHFVYYGNSRIGAPSYDLVHFKDKMPTSFTSRILDREERLSQPAEVVSPLIRNKIWLWVLMGLIIGVLGFFTITMMKGK